MRGRRQGPCRDGHREQGLAQSFGAAKPLVRGQRIDSPGDEREARQCLGSLALASAASSVAGRPNYPVSVDLKGRDLVEPSAHADV
jgi:hypothetical protein